MGALRAAMLLALLAAAPLRAADFTPPVVGDHVRPSGDLLVRQGEILNLLMRWHVADPESPTISASAAMRRPDGSALFASAVVRNEAGNPPNLWLVDAAPTLQEPAQGGTYLSSLLVCNAGALCTTKTSSVRVLLDQDPVAGFVLAPQPLRCPGSWLQFERARFERLEVSVHSLRGARLWSAAAAAAELGAGRMWIGCERLKPGAYRMRVKARGAASGLEKSYKIVVEP